MHAAYAPTPGHEEAVGVHRGAEVTGEGDRGPGPFDRPNRGAEVPGAVVEDDDALGQSAPFVRRDAGLARVDRDRVAERPGERLELRLHDVVRLPPREHADVQGDVGVERDRLEDVPGQRAEVGHGSAATAERDVLLPLGLAGVHAVGTTGHVDDRLHERLVERDGGVAEPADALLVPERLAQRLAEHDRRVLDGVVGVDVQVTGGLDGEVDQRVPGERDEHVVVEADPGRDVVAPGAVEVDLDEDLGLAGLALHPRCAAHAVLTSVASPATTVTSVSSKYRPYRAPLSAPA